MPKIKLTIDLLKIKRRARGLPPPPPKPIPSRKEKARRNARREFKQNPPWDKE